MNSKKKIREFVLLEKSTPRKKDPVIKMVKVNPGSSFEKSSRAWAYNHLVQVLAAL